jgi:hypothetical protein
MEVGKEDLILTQQRILLGKRLLDLDDHLRLGVDGLGVGPDAGPGIGVLRVGDAGPFTCGRLDQHGMTVLDQTLDTGRHHGYAVFVILDLSRNADDHARSPQQQLDSDSPVV